MKLALKEILARKNVRQSELADTIEVSRGFMSDLVSGKKAPSEETLRKIVAALNISPTELYVASGPPQHANRPSGFGEEDVVFVADVPDFTPQAPADSSGSLQVFTATRSSLGLGILKGDTLFVDISARAKRDGIVLATFADEDTGSAKTLVRRVENGALMSGDPTDSITHLSNPSANVAILGVVTQIQRNP